MASVSPNITPRPSISEPYDNAYSNTTTPIGSPQAVKRDLPASPVITASTSARYEGNSSGGNGRYGGGSHAVAKGLPTTLRPIGIINEQNTCFLNSTFQALSSTRPLISLFTSSDSSSLSPGSSIPPAIFPPSRIPALQPDALEPPLYDLLPVTRAFINNLHKAWSMKDNGGGTYGSSETSSGKCMSLRTLLREIARKYDQYDDYRQQDAHELLRHLLDSMEMEEKDIIKKLQPDTLRPVIKKPRGGSRGSGKGLAGISPMPSPLPSPAHSQPSSPLRQTSFDPMIKAGMAVSGAGTAGVQMEEELREIPESQRLVPFVDVLFGGSLASVVVCEKCKSVSHTYEGFLDISLSMKGDEPRARKRDKLKALFRPKASNATKPNISDTANHASGSAASDAELSDSEHAPRGPKDRRKSFDQDERRSDGGSGLSRNSSLKTFGLKAKPSFSFGKKKKDDAQSRPGSSSSAVSIPTIPSQATTTNSESERASIVESSASSMTSVGTSLGLGVPSSPSGGWKHVHGPGPTPAQAAYIQRILANQPGAETVDPLAKLRAANNGEGLAVNNAATTTTTPAAPAEFGLIESLKQFTSVEVLEGENSFACKKCWRIKSGKYQGLHPALKEEDEGEEEELVGNGQLDRSPYDSALLSRRRATAPSISIMSDNSSESHLGINDDRDRSTMTSQSGRFRAPSPLRRQVPESPSTSPNQPKADAISLASSHQTETTSISGGAHGDSSETGPEVSQGEGEGDEASDGLSDTSEESDIGAPPPIVVSTVGRPKMPPRKMSTHFVMRRAFKRYLIAKAPEVLVFHLKRFRQTQKNSIIFTSFYDLKKVDDFVSFPETLDLAPFLAPNRNDYKVTHTPSGPRAPYMDWASVEQGPDLDPVLYRLYAVVVHLGTMIGGHYIAYTLVDPEKMFDDGKRVVDAMRQLDLNGAENGDGVEMPKMETSRDRKRVWCYCSELASLDEVLKAKAYLCFYEKVY